MIGGVNDAPAQADALARRLRGFSPAAHVNLIPLNPTPGFGAPASPPRRVHGLRRAAPPGRRRRPPSAATGAPTSTPPAASSAPGTGRPELRPGRECSCHNGAATRRILTVAGPQRFFDPSQPQTLQIATMLLYLDAVLLLPRRSSLLLFAVAYGAAGLRHGQRQEVGLRPGPRRWPSSGWSSSSPARSIDVRDPLPHDRADVLGGPAGPAPPPPEPGVPEDLVLVAGLPAGGSTSADLAGRAA